MVDVRGDVLRPPPAAVKSNNGDISNYYMHNNFSYLASNDTSNLSIILYRYKYCIKKFDRYAALQ